MALSVVAWLALALGLITAVAIACDCYRRPQPMQIMNVTWPITGLYFPVVGWWLYQTMGRPDGIPRASNHGRGDRAGGHQHMKKAPWQSVFVGTTHCGGGCTLGDSVAIPIVAVTGFSVAGSMLLSHYVAEFIAAYLFGILFQFLPAMSMGQSTPTQALVAAIKADTLALLAFQIGMYGWMALASLVLFVQPPQAGTAVFWFIMQIGMICGFATSYPANWWLIKRGIKHGM